MVSGSNLASRLRAFHNPPPHISLLPEFPPSNKNLHELFRFPLHRIPARALTRTTMSAQIQQLRVRFSGIGEETQEQIKGSRVPIQKTPSFKDKKGGIKWLERQISILMSSSSGYASNEDSELGAAVAAAAYAITMLEEFDSTNNRKSRKGSERKSSGRMERKSSESMERKSIDGMEIKPFKRKEETVSPPSQAGGLSRRLSWKPSSRDESQLIGETSSKKPEIMANGPNPENVAPATPTIKKAATLAEKKNPHEDNKVKTNTLGGPEVTRRRNETTFSSNDDKTVSAWERSQLAVIKKRYEKILETIRSWEDGKKLKAKNKLERTQGELQRRKERAIAEYRNQMDSINTIASEARSQAEKNRKNEEHKVKEKADKIKLTGEVPQSCFCF